jgi:hypothetical protein
MRKGRPKRYLISEDAPQICKLYKFATSCEGALAVQSPR